MRSLLRTTLIVTAVLLLGVMFQTPASNKAFGLSAAPTATASAAPERLAFPLTSPTDEQIREAKRCDLTGLAESRYPTNLDSQALPEAFNPITACDWAVLTVAYANRAGEFDEVLPEARAALFQAVSMNAAFSQALPVLVGYFGKVTLVYAPAFLQQPITKVRVWYSFAGLGEMLDYSYTITDADTSTPVVKGTSTLRGMNAPVNGTIDSKLVQALAPALTDLMPIRGRLRLVECWDDYPDWDVILTFKDGTTLFLETNRSNILFYGGPWQVVLNGHRYMQFSSAFLDAALEIGAALELNPGQTAAMGCGPHHDTLNAAYPSVFLDR